MVRQLEDIFDQALAQLKAGHSIDQIVSQWPGHEAELRGLLTISSQIASIPTNPVPRPLMQRKYAAAKIRTGMWFTWLHFSRALNISVALMLLIAGLAGTAYAASVSLPGQVLFSLKKEAQKIQVALTTNPAARANLQLAIAQERLNEAEQVINSPDTNPAQVAAAVNEVSDQTAAAVSVVKDAASTNSLQGNNPPLLASLQSLTQQQQVLAAQVKTQSGSSSPATQTALASAQSTATQVNEIERIMEVATIDRDENLTNLTQNPNSVTVSGTITQANQNSLTIEKTQFFLSANTSVLNEDTTTPPDLSSLVGEQATVVGALQNNVLMALQVSIYPSLSNIPTATSASSSTATPVTISPAPSPVSTASGIQTQTINPNAGEASQTPDNASATPPNDDQPQPVGSVIFENPAPQFVP